MPNQLNATNRHEQSVEEILQRMVKNVQVRIDTALAFIQRQEAGLVELREESENCKRRLKEHQHATRYPTIIACAWPGEPCVCGEHDEMQHRERDSQ